MGKRKRSSVKVARQYKVDLENKRRTTGKYNANTRPGEHGMLRRRETPYSLQLAAKQSLRYKYGLNEGPFRRLYKRAAALQGATGVILLQLLESRLDNIVFRMGFASTRAEARQLVGHKAILVNGRLINIPSYVVKPGDKIEVREKARQQTRIIEAIEFSKERGISDWLNVDHAARSGVYVSIPERAELPYDINEQLVVELYSK